MLLRPGRRKALSLLEVLAAMAIFLMALTALVHLSNSSADMAGRAFHRSRCSLICQSKLREVMSGAVALQGQSDIPCDEDNDYHWSLDVQSGPTQGLSAVTVRASFIKDKDYPIEVSLSRLVLDPASVGSVQDVIPPVTSTSTTGTTGATGTGTTGMGN
jgi:type II secretion system protein I